jgi:F0F1-type ATP synthase membrane subunit b/b'
LIEQWFDAVALLFLTIILLAFTAIMVALVYTVLITILDDRKRKRDENNDV